MRRRSLDTEINAHRNHQENHKCTRHVPHRGLELFITVYKTISFIVLRGVCKIE